VLGQVDLDGAADTGEDALTDELRAECDTSISMVPPTRVRRALVRHVR